MKLALVALLVLAGVAIAAVIAWRWERDDRRSLPNVDWTGWQ